MRLMISAVAFLGLAACVTTAGPRFEQDVATTFAQDDMRRLQTADVELYYPAAYADQARRVAARATECVRALRALQKTKRDHGRVLLFLTSSNYNNAYVGGQSGGEPLHSLDPLSATEEIFNWYGLDGSDTGDIACHEMFHFVHFEQVENLWKVVNAVVGPVFPSQIFLERWFTEGVAQYYEGRLSRSVGRPHSPLYQGSFDSYVAARHGGLGGGDFSLSQRELSPYSGAYLTGLYFVEWLAQTYGEEKLWDLMDVQGRSVFSPFGATLRFKKVYGLSAGALLDTWNEELSQRVVRERPANQRVLLESVGQFARLATHPASGTIAVVSSGVEDVATLRILSADGTVKVSRKLALFGPGRDWIITSPVAMSGLSFSADGKFLFLIDDDLISRGDTRAKLWKLDAATGDTVQVWDDLGRGLGGSSSLDGRAYTFTQHDPSGGSRVVERDLATGVDTLITEGPPGEALASPAWSPDHSRLLLSQHDSLGWNLVLVTPGGNRKVLTSDGDFNYAPKWVDEHRIVFARADGRYLQAHRLDVDTGRLERLSDTAYGLIDPSPVPGGVAVVNRDGSHWSLDVLPDEPLAVVQEGFAEGEAPAAPPRHEPEPLAVESDEAYSSLDHLFLPQLRIPSLSFSTTQDAAGKAVLVTSLYASLAGKDRLSHHSWALNGRLDLPTLENALAVSYQNYQLAPFSVSVAGERDGFLGETYWTGNLSVDRTFFTSPVSFGVRTEIDDVHQGPLARYVGPFASISYSAVESTPYAGAQRAFAVSLDAAGYGPGSTSAMADLRLGVTLAAPLPLSKRHSFVLSLGGRTLPGAPDGALRIGGVSAGTALYVSQPSQTPAGSPGVFLPGTLVEALRGFDDHAIRATAAALAQARYRYSFIIDKGFMSLLYLFPSIFFRQVDVELFGSGALTNGVSTWARAAGGAVSFRVLLAGALPVSLTYQFAYRFDFGLRPLHTVAFSFE